MSIRRPRLAFPALALALLFALSACRAAPALLSGDPDEVVFFVVSDLHYGASAAADTANAETVQAMNALPGKRFPARAGGGEVPAPRGVVVLGDIVDNGDAPDAAAVWARYAADYGASGEGRLRFPVYDGFGNHDGSPERPVRQAIRGRNPARPGLCAVSADGLHYSWNWGRLHAAHLNLFPGSAGDDIINPWGRKFEGEWKFPRHSLEFLRDDLASAAGKGGRPVVLFQHYGWDEWGRGWWSDRERAALAEALEGYNIAGIFWGHSHAVQRLDWKGIPTWCVGSGNKGPEPGEFLVVRWTPSALVVAERKGGRWGLVDVVGGERRARRRRP